MSSRIGRHRFAIAIGLFSLFALVAVCSLVIQTSLWPPTSAARSKLDSPAVETPSLEGSTATAEPEPTDSAVTTSPGLSADAIDRSLIEVARKADANYDEWPVEVFNESVSGPLKLLQQAITAAANPSQEPLRSLLDRRFQSSDLRPRRLVPSFEDDTLLVSKGPAEDENGYIHQGAEGLADAIAGLIQPWPKAELISVQLKLYRVQLSPGKADTTIAYHAWGPAGDRPLEQHATWKCTWNLTQGGQRPLLASLRVADFHEITSKPKLTTLFTDCTAAVFEHSSVFQQQLAYGIDHWRKRLESSLGPNLSGNQGMTLADFNGDGVEDVFICQQGGLPNRLLFGTAEGRLRDATAESGVDQLELSTSALALDLDEDGDQDLVLAMATRVMFYENDGYGQFQSRTQIAAASTLQSLTAADYDLDGDVDVYACGYSAGVSIWKSNDGLGAPVPYYDANNGGPNLLLRNDGGFAFTNVTEQVGLDANNRRFSFAASWEDYDNDGDADLYVANDFGRNNLYRNDGGQFQDVAAPARVEDMATGMSVCWGDYNNDGWMDLYVGNMFSSAGNRVAYQRQFLPAVGEQTKTMARRVARGNSLFQNGPTGEFVDISEVAEVTRGRWAWASMFTDINNDGWEDLVVANGFITHESPDDL